MGSGTQKYSQECKPLLPDVEKLFEAHGGGQIQKLYKTTLPLLSLGSGSKVCAEVYWPIFDGSHFDGSDFSRRFGLVPACSDSQNTPSTLLIRSTNRIPIEKLVGWSGAGAGVGMLRGAGDSLAWKSFLASWCSVSCLLVSCFLGVLVSWFRRLLVSWFHSFLVSKILGCLVSKFIGVKVSWLLAWFQSFQASKFQTSFNVFKRDWFHITKCPFHVVWKILIPYRDFQGCAIRVVGIGRRPPFPIFSKNDIQYFENSELFIGRLFLSFWLIWGILVSPKIKITGCWKTAHVPKSRNQRNDGSEGSHISKWKSYKFKLEQNNTTPLLSIYAS